MKNSSCIKENLPHSFSSLRNFFLGFLASADTTKAVPVPCRAELQHNSSLKVLDMQGSLCSCERLGTNLMRLAQEGSSPFLGGCRSDPPPPTRGGWVQGRHLPQHHPPVHSGLHWLTSHGKTWKGLQRC